MKKLSVFQITLLAVFGALAVGAVLIFSLAIGGGTTNTIGAVKIWGTLDGTAFATVIRAAADTNPSLSQVTYVQKDPATFDADLTKALASGTGPDLVLLRQDYAVKDSGEIAVIPTTLLSQSQFESTFIPAADPFFSQNGALGIPVLADPLVLYWNKDLLASAGATLPPSYWDELFSLAQKMVVKDSTGNITQSAIAFGEYKNVDNAKDILATLMLQAGNPITTYDTTGHLVSSLVSKTGNGSQASESALRFYTEFADPSKDDYSWSRALPDAQQSFASGALGLYVGYASEASAISRANPNLNFAVAPLPQIRSAPLTLTNARVYALVAARSGVNPSAAITAAAALATTANSQALSQALGIPSARRDVLAAASQKQIPGQLVSATDICKGVDPVICSAQISHSWADPDPDATNGIFQSMIEDTTSGAQLLTAALQRADAQLAQLMSSQQPQQ
jgi:ABC-type glycerol-3-phosphate transport system substrate-binding protein